MGFVYSFIILYTFINAVYPVLYPEYKDNAARYLRKNKHGLSNAIQEKEIRNNYLKMNEDDIKRRPIRKKVAAQRSRGTFKTSGNNIFQAKGIEDDMQGFQKDLMLNLLANRRARNRDLASGSSSSSLEMQNWKDEWRNIWIQKKLEAVNASPPAGDTVNMVAARPWGVPCGDPNQHDMPWGTCMLPMECEGEFRIYRGDYFCGRTQFVCCGLQLTSYDMYQAFDNSFDESSFGTDSEEKKQRQEDSQERKRKKRKQDKKKRKNDRLKRKRRIKKSIQKIIREIRKILNRMYKNGTLIRKKKTKDLKNYIKELKKKYKEDRQSVKELHEIDMIKIDAALMKKLNDLSLMNRNFIKNSTFREIVVNGTMNKKQARMLMEAYPELENWFGTRRSGDLNPSRDYLDYDIEYGYLYY